MRQSAWPWRSGSAPKRYFIPMESRRLDTAWWAGALLSFRRDTCWEAGKDGIDCAGELDFDDVLVVAHSRSDPAFFGEHFDAGEVVVQAVRTTICFLLWSAFDDA